MSAAGHLELALEVVGADAAPGIAALCARSMAKAPRTEEIERTLFAVDRPAVVRYQPGVAAVAVDRGEGNGFVKLLVLDPAHRGRGLGHVLLSTAEGDLTGAKAVTVGADPPYFLFPGTPSTATALCCLLERHHYVREETNYNVDVALDDLPPEPPGPFEPGPSERDALEEWMARHWPNWRDEVLRAFDRRSLVVTRTEDDADYAAICAFEVNRSATLGPVAARPDLIGRGAARGLLVSALHRLRARGHDRVEVLWVGPLVPYARVGGTVGDVFFVYRRRL